MKPTITDPTKAFEFFQAKINFTLGPAELHTWRESEEDFILIDVRAEKDFAEGHIPGAVNLPKDDWSSFAGLDKNKVNVIYCYTHVCHLAATAAASFASQGYPVMEMDGGMKAWRDYKYEVETGVGGRRTQKSTQSLSH